VIGKAVFYFGLIFFVLDLISAELKPLARATGVPRNGLRLLRHLARVAKTFKDSVTRPQRLLVKEKAIRRDS
jgi:hypothetical protein